MSEAGKKVFVSGCFDMLHSGHVEFLQRAAEYGELTVALGSDRTVFELKGRPPINSEEERRFMLANVACVKQAVISRGSGYLDFEPELRELMPDVFVVNEDGTRKISLYWRTLISHRRAPKRWPTPRAPVGTLFWRTI